MAKIPEETPQRPAQAGFHINPLDRQALVEASTGDNELVSLRANFLLALDQGQSTTEIAKNLGATRYQVYYWGRRYRMLGLAAIHPGNPIAQSESANTVKTEAPRKNKGRKNKRKGRQPQNSVAKAAGDTEAVETPTLDTTAAMHQPMQGSKLVTTRPVMGLVPEDTLSEAGRKVFSFFLARMLYHEPGTRLGEDIEELHDMRVATRRMRAAFDIFGAAFKTQRVKTHLKGLRATGRALGAVRDWDVFLEKADRDIHLLAAQDQENLAALLEFWRGEREAARSAMFAYLDSEPYRQFVTGFNTFVQTPGKYELEVKEERFDGEPVPTVHAMAHLAPVLIYTRLGAVRAFADLIPHAKIVQLHALRIQFKSLHYILDFLKEILGPQAKKVLSDVKRMQDHLGDLNDADVACIRLNNLLENWEKNQLNTPLAERQTPASLLAYLSLKHHQRHDLLVSFPAAWKAFDTLALRQQLAEAIAVL